MVKFARSEFERPVARISDKVAGVIEGMQPLGAAPLWREAVKATLALHRAPQHFLRSQLVLLGSLAGGGAAEGDELETFAAGMELLHLFMLVHDDVIDEASLRRGCPSVHRALLLASPTLGANRARDLAVVVGNTLNVLAIRHLLCGGRGRAACEVVIDACLHTGVGQFEDVVGWRGERLDGDATFLAAVENKTAYHAFAAPFAGGLRFANLEADLTPAIAWGRRMGVALQGLDDIGDLVGDPAVTGKDHFRDVLEGRLSLGLFLLRRRAAADEREFLASVVGHGTLDPADREEFERLVEKHDVIQGGVEFVRGELAGAASVRQAAKFGVAAEGMSLFEEGLLKNLESLITQR